MRNILIGAAAAATVFSLGTFAQDDRVARGKYLVEQVARCQDCHTPHLMGTGEPVRSAWMKGAQLDFVKIEPPQNWHSKAPDITSTGPIFATWGEEGVAKFLETGRTPHENHAGAPMPQYLLTREDAQAVAAYLKSLK